MKKNYLFLNLIVMFILLGSSLVADTYIVNSPSQGEKWGKMGIHKIQWLKLGDNAKKVSIFLYSKEGKKKIIKIAENINNTGEYICPFGKFQNIPEGEYKIVIINSKGKILGRSKIFKITDKTNINPDKTMKVLTPFSNVVILPGKTLKIEWETKVKHSENFLIELYTPDRVRKVMMIKRILPPAIGLSSKTNTLKKHFKYEWKIPSNIPSGSYIIKISIPEKDIKTYTPIIKIDRKLIKKDIRRHWEK